MAIKRLIPIIPIPVKEPFDDPDWLFEPRFEWYRGFLYVDGALSYFNSKKDNPLSAFAGLAQNIREELPVSSAVLDGEITVLDPKTGYSDINALKLGQGTPIYLAFDLLWLNDQNLTGLKLIARKQLLRELTRNRIWIRSVDSVEGSGKKFMEQIVAAGLDGMVAKQKFDVYSPRTRWLKVLSPSNKDLWET